MYDVILTRCHSSELNAEWPLFAMLGDEGNGAAEEFLTRFGKEIDGCSTTVLSIMVAECRQMGLITSARASVRPWNSRSAA